MAQVMNGSSVKVHMTQRLQDGSLVGTTTETEPLEIKVGEDKSFVELHEVLLGMNEGETRQFVIPSEKAYGPFREDLVFELEKNQIPVEIELQKGKKLMASFKDGKSSEVTVVDVGDDKVTLDANHALAGKDLLLQVKVVEVAA